MSGTRVMVSTLLGALDGGDSVEMILEDYPNIDSKDVTAALIFSSELSQLADAQYKLE